MSISFEDIRVFGNGTRSENDKRNKMRESIIGFIINNKVPKDFYERSGEWKSLKHEIFLYIKMICDMNDIDDIRELYCENKAGRGHHYDFSIFINKIEYKVEFKFNADKISDTPQFVSPMNPSRYLESNYEEYFYDNYLTKSLGEYELPIPSKEVYLNKINSSEPQCMKEFQAKYYKGCSNSSKYTGEGGDVKFYNDMKRLSNESIKSFVSSTNLCIDKLSEYLLRSQKGKMYMLYKNGKISIQVLNEDDYTITSVVKDPTKYRYVATTKSGKTMKILLRWKNGNGIAYPAFQIS